MYNFVRKNTGEFNLRGKAGLRAAAILREISTKKGKLDTWQSLGQQEKCSGGKTKHQRLHLVQMQVYLFGESLYQSFSTCGSRSLWGPQIRY